jgi:ABC-type glycerol-3-phosphate transport system substrate-binding protein
LVGLLCSFPGDLTLGLRAEESEPTGKMGTHRSKWAAFFAVASMAAPVTASAEDLILWMRDNGATVAARVIDHWNEAHPADHVTLTLIPHEQMMPTFASALSAGKAPDLLSLDLILTPDFMKAGYLKDITDPMARSPNIKKVVQAHIDLATYKKRLYGVPFTPDDSVLLYNKALFKQAGLDAEKPPTTSGEIVSAARKIRALGPDVYGFYFSRPTSTLASPSFPGPLGGMSLPSRAATFSPSPPTRSMQRRRSRSSSGSSPTSRSSRSMPRPATCRRAPISRRTSTSPPIRG